MKETVAHIQNSLESLYPPEDIRCLTRWILEKVCGLSPLQQIRCKDTQISFAKKMSVQNIVQRLAKGEPIQYIFREAEFYGLILEVNPSVLIPRPETEELVVLAHERLCDRQSSGHLRILDLGTGSGCIAVKLAKCRPEAEVYAVDISEPALETARRNACRNDVFVHFLQADILADEWTAGLPDFDLIISNPPYVKESEQADMNRWVLEHEPHTALFVPDSDPLLFYRAIAVLCEKKLAKNGLLCVEINPACSDEIAGMLSRKGFRAEQQRDLSGKERFIIATK